MLPKCTTVRLATYSLASLLILAGAAAAEPPWQVLARQQAMVAAQQRAVLQQEAFVARQQAWIAAQQRQRAALLEVQRREVWRAARRQEFEQAALHQAAEQASLQRATLTLVTLVNPGRNGSAVNYSVDGRQYTLWPGRERTLAATSGSVVAFHRGGMLGWASYVLSEDRYHFVLDDRRGWDLLPADQAVDKARVDEAPASNSLD